MHFAEADMMWIFGRSWMNGRCIRRWKCVHGLLKVNQLNPYFVSIMNNNAS